MKRRTFAVAVGSMGAGLMLDTSSAWSATPKLAKKDKYTIGFAQTETSNPWRVAQTQSMQDEAKKRGFTLVYTDAGGNTAKQVTDVKGMIQQKVDLIFLSPREEKPLAPLVKEAAKAGIPVILIDRNIDPSLATPGEDYVTFIGSDFIDEGKRVGEWLAKTTNGKATIIELEGTTGSSPANDRKKGFNDVIAKHPGMKVVASQTGDFARDKGRQVAEALLKANPTADVIYAHNDEMAIGAIAAVEAAGKKPGKDIRILSIDGGKEAVGLVADGKIDFIVECSPKFGRKGFATLMDYVDGAKIPAKIVNPDRDFSAQNAKELLATAY